MNRRRLLVACGASFAGAAGCLSESPATRTDDSETTTDDTPTESPPNGSPTPTDTTTGDGLVVENIGVEKAITYESTMGSGGVLAAEDQQYVVASVRSDRELDDATFSFETDDGTWEPGLPDTVGAVNRSVAGRGGGPVSRRRSLGSDGGSYLAFAVPSPLSAANPRIRVTGAETGEWPLPADARERLSAPEPRFELDDLSVPADVPQGETLSVSLTATNVSDTDGRFLAAVYWPTKLIADDDESTIVERTVDAGDDVTASIDLDTRFTTSEAEPVALSVRGHVSADRDVQVTDASTPS